MIHFIHQKNVNQGSEISLCPGVRFMHSDNSTASNLPIRFSHLMIIGGIAIVGLYWQSLSFAAEMKHRPVYGCLQLQGSSQHLSGSADRPYIPLMKQEGVRRALFEI